MIYVLNNGSLQLFFCADGFLFSTHLNYHHGFAYLLRLSIWS